MRYWIFDYHEDFAKKWRGETPLQKELKLRNNFYYEGKSPNGIPYTGIRQPTEKEQEQLNRIKLELELYNKMRDEYTADRVFHEIGYEEFLEEINYSKIEMHDYTPCMSADKQCSFNCYWYEECQKII